MPRPFAVIGIAFFITLVILSYLNETAAVSILFVSCVCFVPLISIKSFREQAVLPSAFLAIAAGCIMFLAFNEFEYKPATSIAGDKVSLNGEIIGLPIKENGRFYYPIKTNSVNNKPVHVKIRLSCSEPLDAEPYDAIETEAMVYLLGKNNEDSLQYYRTMGVYLGAYSYSDIKIETTENKPIMFHILSLKQTLLNNINKLLPNETGGLVAALLFGDKSNMSDETLRNFREIGISHIIAISGLNLSIFFLIFLDLSERLKFNKRITYILSLILVLIVMALAGFSASVLRAGIMLITMLLGKLINKEADALNSIGFAVLLLSLFNPLGAGYIGLQLSFFATLGILTIQGRISKPFNSLADKINRKPVRRTLKFVIETITVTLSSVIFTLPTIIITFQRVAIMSVLSNLLLVYTSTLAMIFGGIAAITSSFPFLGLISNPSAIISGLLSKYIIKSSGILAGLRFASINVKDQYFSIWLAGVLLLMSATVVLYKIDHRTYFKLSAILCTATLLIGILSNKMLNGDVTTITVANVGNASASIIASEGRAILVGCGGEDFDSENILNALDANNSDSIDLMLIPRTEATESGAIKSVLKHYRVDKIVAPALNYDLEYIISQKHLEISPKLSTNLWAGATLQYIYTESISCAYADLEGTTILFVFFPGCDVSRIPPSWKKSDILICRSKFPDGLNCLAFNTIIISADGDLGTNEALAINALGGNAISTATTGNVFIKSRGNSIYSIAGENNG